MNVVEFLNARLDEDKEAADEAPDRARHLREVAAKRRIVEDYRISAGAVRRVAYRDLDAPGLAGLRAGRDAFLSAIHTLAAVYSDHPDYRPTWGD